MPHITAPRHLAKPLVSLLTSAALVLSLAPTGAWADVSSTPPEPTQEQITQLLDEQEYAEGEVIVVAEAGTDLGPDAHELLATADEDALALTADAKLADDDPTQAISAQRANASEAAAYEVFVVRSDAKSTQQLIDELYDNPQVISVEPNALVHAPTSGGQAADAGLYAQSDAGYPTVGDLTPQQWYFHNDGTYSTFEGTAQPGVDMAVPGQGAEPETINSSGVIAIVDSGLDVNHPDLKDALYTFTPDQQERFGCGEHGLNASTTDPAKRGDLTDHDGHGTHVAGVAAASWNGEGVSGVANGAKLIGVRVAGDDGSQTAESGVRAFNFLISCAKELNIKAVNCSWSSPSAEFTYTLLANQLGKQGAVTLFAAGNEHTDIGQALDTSSFTNSPYLLTVGAHNPAGGATAFSNYSATSVDVFAPGAQMLSTVPAKANDGLKHFLLPMSADEDGIATLCTFAEGQDEGVAIYATNPLADWATPLDTTTVTDVGGVDDAYSLAIPIESIPDDEGGHGIKGETHSFASSFFAAIPLPEQEEDEPIGYISARFSAMLKTFNAKNCLDQMDMAIMGVAIQDSTGATRIVDMRDDESGYFASAETRAGIFSWLCSTLEVSHLLQDGEQVYTDEQGRMLVEIGIVPDPAYSMLCVDNIAVGTTDAKAGAYALMNGSSMAAPAAAGAVAIVAKDEPANADAPDPSELALQRAARLRGATVWSDQLDGVCATGGYINLNGLDASKTAPIITSASTSGGSRYLQVEGHFLGTEGDVTIDGANAQTTARDNDSLVVQLPQGLSNGAHVLMVSTANGRDKYAFTTSDVQDQLKQYERELAVPDFFSTADLAGERGFDATIGGLVVSGDHIYTLEIDADMHALCLWQYSIANDSWKNCGPLPVNNFEPYGTVLASSADGVILCASENADESEAQADDDSESTARNLYSYRASDGIWTKMATDCELPEYASIFSKGDDLYFVGGRYQDNSTLLCVYHTKSDQLEVMEDLPEEAKEEVRGLIAPSSVAVGGEYIYVGGIKNNALLRLHVNDEGKVDKFENLTESLTGTVVTGEKITDANRPAVAATPVNGLVVGTELDATDTYTLAPTANTLEPLDYTSSFYHSNMNAAVWHDDVLYAIGYSPSEQGRVFFRAHSYPVAHDDPEPEPVSPTNTPGTPDTPPQEAQQSGTTQPVQASSSQATQVTRTTSRAATPSTADTLPSWNLLALVGCALLGIAPCAARKPTCNKHKPSGGTSVRQ